MPKQRVYEVRIREYHDATVLVAAHSVGEARRAAAERYDNGLLVLEFSEVQDPDEWPVTDTGEDPGQ